MTGEESYGEGWELRFTWRALQDLRAEDELPGIIEDVRKKTPYTEIVEAFQEKRTHSQVGSDRFRAATDRDLYTLHAADPYRAVTWFDEEHGVCWFLGFTPGHVYSELENRADDDELLPDERDYRQLLAERDQAWHMHRAGQQLQDLVDRAQERPNHTIRKRLDGSLLCDVFAEVLIVGDPDAGGDVWIAFTTHPWPSDAWLPRDFEAALLAAVEPFRVALEMGAVAWRCAEFPTDADEPDKVEYRPVDQARQSVVRFRLE